MKYTVKVREVNDGVLTVDADSPEEAREIAEQEYYNGNVFWKGCEFDVISVERQKTKDISR